MREKQANLNRSGKTTVKAILAVLAAVLAVGAGAPWAWAGPGAGDGGDVGESGQTGPIIGGPTAGVANPTIFSLKFGYQTKPAAESFGDAWLIGLCWDFGINRNLAFGMEIQPALRSVKELGLTSFPVLGWLHLKVGEDLGRFVPALKPVKLYAGAGAGGEATLTVITLAEMPETKFAAHFAYKLMGGAIINLGGLSLVLEYQMARISDPLLDPHFWRHHIFLGFVF